MAVCINKNLSEYQALKKMSGIPETVLDFYCSRFIEKYDRFPELDELPHVNSESYLKQALDSRKVGQLDFVDTANVFSLTGTENIQEANIKLNDICKDLEVTLVEVSDDSVLIETRKRPSKFETRTEKFNPEFDVTSANNRRTVLRNMLGRMRKLYGINIIEVSSEDLATGEFYDIIPDAKTANAFVFNGNIYINTEYADLDAPIHELTHIILGAMRYTNPSKYFEIISLAENFKSLEKASYLYKDRTRNDLLEECFVHEFANYLVGIESDIDNLDAKILDTLMYNLTRNMDTMIMGNKSVNGIEDWSFQDSFLDLAMRAQSSELNQVEDVNNMDLATLHRKTANLKSKLLKDGNLIEKCE
jgi:hypothetical protein